MKTCCSLNQRKICVVQLYLEEFGNTVGMIMYVQVYITYLLVLACVCSFSEQEVIHITMC